MTYSRTALLVFTLTTLTFTGAAFADTGIKEADGKSGKFLTDDKGMTLYTFDKDEAGKSVCYDKCAANWPPLVATAAAQAEDDFSIIDRTDGTKQWAYYGKPLYLWVKDKAPGDVTGDGVGGVWHTAVKQ